MGGTEQRHWSFWYTCYFKCSLLSPDGFLEQDPVIWCYMSLSLAVWDSLATLLSLMSSSQSSCFHLPNSWAKHVCHGVTFMLNVLLPNLKFMPLMSMMIICTTSQGSTKWSQAWWHKLVIPALGRLKQEDGHKFKVSLGYIVSSRPIQTAWWDSVSKINKNNLKRLTKKIQF